MLTNEQKNIIELKGNLLVVGRSGTGKTTCAMLRLFSIEMLFRIRKYAMGGNFIKDTRFRASHVDNTCGFHSVFITASPVLTNEIRRYYIKFKEKIKEELNKKERKNKKVIPKLIELINEESKTSKGKESLENEQDQILQKFSEIRETEEALELKDEGELEQQFDMVSSLEKVDEKQFPLFLTFRRLLLMIDATLKRPFFTRDSKNNVIGLHKSAEWHNESGGTFMINSVYKMSTKEGSLEMGTEDSEQLISAFERKEQERASIEVDDLEAPQYTTDKIRKGKRPIMGKEVDFEIFKNKFWPTLYGRVQFGKNESIASNPAGAWMIIQTYIKGSKEFCYGLTATSRESIAFRIQSNRLLNIDSKKVFRIYRAYERWCAFNNYYDLSDIIKHVHYEITNTHYLGTPIHFIMCDEVQDLTPAMLDLLLRLAEHNVFFSGDTAQTISKGINFSFNDLMSMIDNFSHKSKTCLRPQMIYLTTNFRSHNRILAMANSIISLLEICFPGSIDNLSKEKSDNDGMIPIALDSKMQSTLFNFLSTSSGKGSNKIVGKGPIEFGCDQVILVRDQQSKERLPSFLGHALCLTIYEAKGLEFEDVILYNFFTDSEEKDKWELINAMEVTDEYTPANNVYGKVLLQSFDNTEPTKGSNEEAKKRYKKVSIRKNTRVANEKYNGLITELKHLYTAITRAKKRVIIFDEEPNIRKPVLNYWLSLGYIKVITEEGLEEINESTKDLFDSLSGKNVSKAGWKAQGVKMFVRKYYKQAMKCFENSGDIKLKEKAEGYYAASHGAELLADVETKKYELSIKKLKNAECEEWNAKLEDINKKAIELFNKAGEIFTSLGLSLKAGQCYFSIKNYEKAVKCFEEANLLGQAGEAYMMMGEYLKAGELYEEIKVPANAIIAYDKLKDYKRIINCLHKFKDEFETEYRRKLILKYVKKELESISREYESGNEVVVNDIQKDKDAINKNSIAEPNEFEVIDPECSNPFEEVNTSNITNPFKDQPDSEDSFAKVNTSDISKSSEEDKNKNILYKPKLAIDIDHISGIDPEDEWLKCETGSIIDSIVSGEINLTNHASDYLMLDNAQASIINASLVVTKRNIFIEDITMSKIIKCISYFSEEVKNYLKSMRSNKALVHTKCEPDAVISDFIVDLDEIDLPFVKLLLDILEEYKLYKLCLMICNRYQINERIGRYLISIGHQYSNIKIVTRAIEKYGPSNMIGNITMQINNSIIANKAIHNALEMVNPSYIKMKTFGDYFNKYMLLLGYWKKLVYIVDCETALAITSTFGDYVNFKNVYTMNFGKHKGPFNWLPFTSPSNPLEVKAFKVALDEVSFELKKSIINDGKEKKCPDFPVEFKCNGALWKVLLGNKNSDFDLLSSTLDEGIHTFLSLGHTKSNVSELAIWDFCVVLMQMMFGIEDSDRLKEFFLKLDCKTYNNLLKCTHKAIKILCQQKVAQPNNERYTTAYLALLVALGIRKIEFRLGCARLFCINRNSMCFNIVVKTLVAEKEKMKEEIRNKVNEMMKKKQKEEEKKGVKKVTIKEFNDKLKEEIRKANLRKVFTLS